MSGLHDLLSLRCLPPSFALLDSISCHRLTYLPFFCTISTQLAVARIAGTAFVNALCEIACDVLGRSSGPAPAVTFADAQETVVRFLSLIESSWKIAAGVSYRKVLLVENLWAARATVSRQTSNSHAQVCLLHTRLYFVCMLCLRAKSLRLWGVEGRQDKISLCAQVCLFA